jgi:chemotaxis protein MotA
MIALVFLVLSFGIVVGAAFMGGQAAAFASASSALLVLAGTISVTAVSFHADDLKRLPRGLAALFRADRQEPVVMAKLILELLSRTRREGVTVLEAAQRGMRNNPFLARAIGMIADGVNPTAAEALLKEEADILARRQLKSAEMLRRAADVAPAMGLIGTLIGLVQMLGALSSPEKLGPAMALALLTTLYGAVMAHVLLLPLAVRAESQAETDHATHTLCAVGAGLIGRLDNPLHAEAALNSLLPAGQRVRAA